MYVNNNPSVGDTLQVRITAKQSYGVFAECLMVEIGLIRLNDISWQNQAKNTRSIICWRSFYGEVIKELQMGN